MLQSFERLMTFYTPDLPSGLPGSFPSVQMVPPDHVPGEVEEPLSLHLIIICVQCSKCRTYVQFDIINRIFSCHFRLHVA